jgi:spore germination protein GerM
MRTHEKLALFVTLLLFVVSPDVDAQVQYRPRFATRQVKIYLWKGSSSELEPVPVQRNVQRITPARGAIEALLAGPTEEESRSGLRAPHTEGVKIKSLTISDGVARISLVSDSRWSGTMAPARLKEAMELTLKQFDTVRRVKVSFNGQENVGRW